MSVMTRSGTALYHLEQLLAVLGFANEFQVGLVAQQQLEAIAEDLVVVGDDKAYGCVHNGQVIGISNK